MKIVIRKLDKNMQGPKEFAVLTEQELIERGYKWDYEVFNDAGLCVRTGTSTMKSKKELIAYLESGMNRLQWEAIHGQP